MAVLRPVHCALTDVTKAPRNLSTSKLIVPKIAFPPPPNIYVAQCLFLNTSLDFFFQFTINLSSRTVALGSTQPLTQMSTRIIHGGIRRPTRKAANLTATCEPIV
jgi:hypothetical protein